MSDDQTVQPSKVSGDVGPADELARLRQENAELRAALWRAVELVNRARDVLAAAVTGAKGG